MAYPVIVQGGMGVGISGWRLASAVARADQLGIVSGTGLDSAFARRLQNGDADGSLRRALAHFPIPEIAQSILDEHFISGGKAPDEPFRLAPVFTAEPSVPLHQLAVAANFCEVFLAKEGHEGQIGINYLEKIKLPNLASIYGAMLADVDYVFMGAGIPREIPSAIDRFTRHEPASLRLDVVGAEADDDYRTWFDPKKVLGDDLPEIGRPEFVAIVSSSVLATSLAKKTEGEVNGFVVEGHAAGGHNAPPRGAFELNDRGEPMYGPRDEVDLSKIKRLGLPFWLAGACDYPEKLREALDAGASGVQIGTSFAFCNESGLPTQTRDELIQDVLNGSVDVVTDPCVSPAGFPFKVIQKAGSLSDKLVYDLRKRVCDLGYLTTFYKKPDGSIGYRCPAEPVASFVAKGGDIQDTIGRKCLCNALMANVGLAQARATGYVEQLLLTAGDCLRERARFVSERRATYSAAEVISYMLQTASAAKVG